jgi:hypothetical protein
MAHRNNRGAAKYHRRRASKKQQQQRWRSLMLWRHARRRISALSAS